MFLQLLLYFLGQIINFNARKCSMTCTFNNKIRNISYASFPTNGGGQSSDSRRLPIQIRTHFKLSRAMKSWTVTKCNRKIRKQNWKQKLLFIRREPIQTHKTSDVARPAWRRPGGLKAGRWPWPRTGRAVGRVTATADSVAPRQCCPRVSAPTPYHRRPVLVDCRVLVARSGCRRDAATVRRSTATSARTFDAPREASSTNITSRADQRHLNNSEHRLTRPCNNGIHQLLADAITTTHYDFSPFYSSSVSNRKHFPKTS